jgi:hypothetical protein
LGRELHCLCQAEADDSWEILNCWKIRKSYDLGIEQRSDTEKMPESWSLVWLKLEHLFTFGTLCAGENLIWEAVNSIPIALQASFSTQYYARQTNSSSILRRLRR